MTLNRASSLTPLAAPLQARTMEYPLLPLTWKQRDIAPSGINLPLNSWKVTASSRTLVQLILHFLKAEVSYQCIASHDTQPTSMALTALAAPAPLCCPTLAFVPRQVCSGVLDIWACPLCSTLCLSQAAIVCGRWAFTAGCHVEGWHHNLQLLSSLLS